MFNVPEKYRSKQGNFASNSTFGNNGLFIIPHQTIDDYFFRCIASESRGWEHVSISLMKRHKDVPRNPTWLEMCFIKDLFWQEEARVIQFHPPKSEYVNNHPYCLHLWRPYVDALPFPPSEMVGFKNE